MSEYMFGVGRGRVDGEIVDKVQEVAEKHDCDFVHGYFPGDGFRYWFAGPNRGHPFDREMGRAVIDDLEIRDLWPIPTTED